MPAAGGSTSPVRSTAAWMPNPNGAIFPSVISSNRRSPPCSTGRHKQPCRCVSNVSAATPIAWRNRPLKSARSRAASVLNVTKAAEEQAKSLGKQLDRIEKRQSGTRTKLGAGAALGIAGLVLICLLFANTAPTRWLSIRLLGESDSASAAWSLAGDGRTKGELMAETKGLLGDDTYRVRYAECVDHAKRMKKPFPCRLTFPPLLGTTP